MFRLTVPAVLAAVLVLYPSRPDESAVHGCAAVPPRGFHVEIGEESAIIIWDAESKTQHFIRRASFTTAAKDFGFLVPTPSRPTLAEADDQAFRQLAQITAPPIRYAPAPSGGGCGCAAAKQAAAPAGKVDVLEEKRVAGYDTAVLAATDAGELNKWLGDHGYESSDALRKWLEPYVAQKWIVTAFKVANDAPNVKVGPAGNTTLTGGPPKDEKAAAASPSGLTTSAVRMTFKTDRPFFPYREPADQRDPNVVKGSRLLRVYFIGTERFEGTVGDAGAWNGVAKWSKPLQESDRGYLIGALKLEKAKVPTTWWLTDFEDRSSPRPGTDEVYFRPAKDQSTLERQGVTIPNNGGSPGWFVLAGCGLVIALVYAKRAWRRTPRLRYGIA